MGQKYLTGRNNFLLRITFLVSLFAAKIASAETLAACNDAFAFDLYAQLKNADCNLFFSPYSISACLGMVYTGARGETARQMSRTLHFTAAPGQLAAEFAALQGKLDLAHPADGVEFNIANGMWAQMGFPFEAAFLDGNRQHFGAELKQVDFRRNAEPIRQEINHWASEKTRGKITGILPAGAPPPRTKLILVNAIYFKANWAEQFQKKATIDADFSVTPAQKVKTPLMHLAKRFNYAETEDLQLLELPYTNGNQSMIVLLPNEIDGLKKLERALSQEHFADLLGKASRREVSVFLPKFKLTSQFALADTLAAMGMSDAFTSKADFSGIDGQRDLLISAVVHKAYVDVYEEGTESAAVTGVMVGRAMAMPQRSVLFRADHPFVFLIRDNRTGSILFLGRVLDPTK